MADQHTPNTPIQARALITSLGPGRFVMRPHLDRPIDLVAPDPANVRIEDIARSLARINRYVGQTETPYTVAEHSIRVSHLMPAGAELKGLLHDAHEYVTNDIPRPVKQLLAACGCVIRALEDNLNDAIGRAFDIDLSMTEILREADDIAGQEEQASLRAEGISPTGHVTTCIDDAARIEVLFLERYRKLRAQETTSGRAASER